MKTDVAASVGHDQIVRILAGVDPSASVGKKKSDDGSSNSSGSGSGSGRRNYVSPTPTVAAPSVQSRGKGRNSISPPTSTSPSPKHQHTCSVASPSKIVSTSVAPFAIVAKIVPDRYIKVPTAESVHDGKELHAEDNEKVVVKESTWIDQTANEQAMKMETLKKIEEANVDQASMQNSIWGETVAEEFSKEDRVEGLEKGVPLKVMKTKPSTPAKLDVLPRALLDGLAIGSMSFISTTSRAVGQLVGKFAKLMGCH